MHAHRVLLPLVLGQADGVVHLSVLSVYVGLVKPVSLRELWQGCLFSGSLCRVEAHVGNAAVFLSGTIGTCLFWLVFPRFSIFQRVWRLFPQVKIVQLDPALGLYLLGVKVGLVFVRRAWKGLGRAPAHQGWQEIQTMEVCAKKEIKALGSKEAADSGGAGTAKELFCDLAHVFSQAMTVHAGVARSKNLGGCGGREGSLGSIWKCRDRFERTERRRVTFDPPLICSVSLHVAENMVINSHVSVILRRLTPQVKSSNRPVVNALDWCVSGHVSRSHSTW